MSNRILWSDCRKTQPLSPTPFPSDKSHTMGLFSHKSSRQRDELFNRHGRWFREMYARSDPWPVIEHWASESGYALVSLKGQRRTYRKGISSSFFTIFIDVRQEKDTLHLSAWVDAGFWARLLYSFFIPSELAIHPSGWRGVRVRRQACRDLNELLGRLKQRPILGSESLHIADFDSTTILLGCAVLFPLLGFCLYYLSRVNLIPGLTNSLLYAVGKHIGILSLLAIGLLFFHDGVIVRKICLWPWKLASSMAGTAIFWTVLIVCITRTGIETTEMRLTFYCVHQYHPTKCPQIIEGLSEEGRKVLLERLQQLYEGLSRR